jgi:hypothetical protein
MGASSEVESAPAQELLSGGSVMACVTHVTPAVRPVIAGRIRSPNRRVSAAGGTGRIRS